MKIRPQGFEPMTHEQRKRLNAMCGDVANQVPWMLGGSVRHMTKDEWRHFFVAHVMGNATAPSIDGDRIIIFSRSSNDMDKEQATRCIDLIMHFGDSKQVQWTDPKLVQLLNSYEVAA